MRRSSAAGPGLHAAAGGSSRPALLAIVALCLAEAVVAFVGPVPGAVLHAALLLVLLLGWVAAGDPALLVLALVPTGRITALALTVDSSGAGAYALAGLPLAVAVGWLLKDLGYRRPDVRRRPSWHAAAVASSGIPLGAVVHGVLELPAADGLPVVLAAPLVFVFVGVLEELLYRGLVQRALTEASGTAGVVLADVLFTAAYLPTRDAGLVLVMAVLGLASGWYVHRTRGLAAVAVAHGLLAAGALVVWPVWT